MPHRKSLVPPAGNPGPVCGEHFLGFPAARGTSNLLFLVQLIGGKLARSRAANGGELASGCTSRFWIAIPQFSII
jgi:hypothetical protein